MVEGAHALDNDSRKESDSDDDHHARQPHRRASSRVRFCTIVPQAKPLSPGEVLGSTLPWGGDKEGDVGRRSKRDSKITPRMATFMGKENRGLKAKAAATTRHDGGGQEEVGESNTEGDVPATTRSANPGANTHEGRHP